MDDIDLPAQLGQGQRVLGGAVAAAGHHHGFAAVEHAVAGGAVRHAAAPQPLLGGQAQGTGVGAHGQDDAVGHDLAGVGDDLFRRGGQVRRLHVGKAALGAELLCAGLHFFGQLKAVDAGGKAGIVFDPVGGGHLAAGGHALEDQGAQPRADAVQRCGVAARSAADDHNVVSFAHLKTLLSVPGRRKSGCFFRDVFF